MVFIKLCIFIYYVDEILFTFDLILVIQMQIIKISITHLFKTIRTIFIRYVLAQYIFLLRITTDCLLLSSTNTSTLNTDKLDAVAPITSEIDELSWFEYESLSNSGDDTICRGINHIVTGSSQHVILVNQKVVIEMILMMVCNGMDVILLYSDLNLVLLIILSHIIVMHVVNNWLTNVYLILV